MPINKRAFTAWELSVATVLVASNAAILTANGVKGIMGDEAPDGVATTATAALYCLAVTIGYNLVAPLIRYPAGHYDSKLKVGASVAQWVVEASFETAVVDLLHAVDGEQENVFMVSPTEKRLALGAMTLGFVSVIAQQVLACCDARDSSQRRIAGAAMAAGVTGASFVSIQFADALAAMPNATKPVLPQNVMAFSTIMAFLSAASFLAVGALFVHALCKVFERKEGAGMNVDGTNADADDDQQYTKMGDSAQNGIGGTSSDVGKDEESERAARCCCIR